MRRDKYDRSMDLEIKDKTNLAISLGQVRVEDTGVTRFVNDKKKERKMKIE